MGGDVTVLVVDDDATIRMLCRINLEIDGYRVVEAATLPEAQGKLEEGRVDALLLDVHIAGGDGREFFEQVRRSRPGLPVAFLTGTADVDELARVGADAIIGKPFALTELLDTVQRLAGPPR